MELVLQKASVRIVFMAMVEAKAILKAQAHF